jgi:hypothetical protein
MSQAEENAKFIEQFEENAKIALKAAENATKHSVADLYKLLYDTSVVGNPALWKTPAPPGYTPGTLKKGWRISFSGYRNDSGQFTSSESITQSHGMSLSINGGGTKTAYIWNTTPYLERIEYQGWSKQAPNGFVRIAVMQFTSIVDGNAAKFRTK